MVGISKLELYGESFVEKVLSEIDPNWKAQELYIGFWDIWDGSFSKDGSTNFSNLKYAPWNVYDLSDFKHNYFKEKRLMIYQKDKQFVIAQIIDPHNYPRYITNIKPKEEFASKPIIRKWSEILFQL